VTGLDIKLKQVRWPQRSKHCDDLNKIGGGKHVGLL
jgi:hypothetical protein